jgi:hypothetical protein
MAIDAGSHFAGKRKAERRTVDLRVELRGGGIVLQGRGVDLSPQGIGVLLSERTFQGFRATSDAVGTLALLQRHFTSGVEVRFSVHGNVKVAAQIVRLNTPTKPGGDLTVGCKFNRPLTPPEWSSLTGTAPPKPAAPLRGVKTGPAIQVLLFDPAAGPTDGPIQLLHVLRGSEEAIEAVVHASHKQTVEEVRTMLDRGAIPARITSTDGIAWDGSVRLAEARVGVGGDIVLLLEALKPWSTGLLKRLPHTK